MTVLKGPKLIERLNATMPATGRMLGQKVIEADPEIGRVVIDYEIGPEFCNPMGSVQGGFVAAMLDDASAIACIVKAGRRIGVPTLEMKVSFIAPARAGRLRAVGEVIKLGRSIAFLEARLYAPEGKLLAHATQTAKPVNLD